MRKIRVDLKTPRRPTKELESDCEGSDSSFSNPSEAKRLEEKVAKAAANKCSFEEVSELHKEIQSWLKSEVKRTSAAQVTQLHHTRNLDTDTWFYTACVPAAQCCASESNPSELSGIF